MVFAALWEKKRVSNAMTKDEKKRNWKQENNEELPYTSSNTTRVILYRGYVKKLKFRSD